MLLGAHLQCDGCAPGPEAALWGHEMASSFARTWQEKICVHGAWGIPQPSQAVALHCVDKEVDGLSFGRVYCNTLDGSKKLSRWW